MVWKGYQRIPANAWAIRPLFLKMGADCRIWYATIHLVPSGSAFGPSTICFSLRFGITMETSSWIVNVLHIELEAHRDSQRRTHGFGIPPGLQAFFFDVFQLSSIQNCLGPLVSQDQFFEVNPQPMRCSSWELPLGRQDASSFKIRSPGDQQFRRSAICLPRYHVSRLSVRTNLLRSQNEPGNPGGCPSGF